MSRLSAALLVIPAVALTLSAGTAAVAAPASTGVSFVVTAATDPAEDRYRTLVRRLADKDPRWEVRTAAWNALTSDVPNAVTLFLSTGGGYELARARASTNASRNDLIISRAILTSTPATSPYVNMTAKRAQYGTLDEKDRYVRTGLAEAQALDAKHSPVAHAAEQDALDRQYVTDLSEHASGAWVKAAAVRALQRGTNDDIAEFFKYSWSSAAACDVQAFRINLTEQEATYRHRLDQLVVSAQAAQQAYEQASEAAKAKAAEEAKLAWNTAAGVAAATQETWTANQNLAASQAQAWAAVHDFAVGATTRQDWPTIAGQAAGTQTSWNDELAWAQEQARVWTGLEQSARDSATAIPTV
ncbi:hypothetical protein GCM10010172_36190 [Paractinoplanes ferrugineus]|uniref:Uncharacterized protein n=1 Tax=Paractinoplanes ferrugineus TaxID=113564 RepID=A0A919IVG2_9ACTN|nr:ALF repeat-containing protein [Actinoplanes ferrugineus]GIE09215.1 hypothetical protein Afe05nite_10550 [Actinoplanes ferrugineus]